MNNSTDNPVSTILVVEDNPQAAKLLSVYLNQAGYQVLTAQNGSEALMLAAQCQRWRLHWIYCCRYGWLANIVGTEKYAPHPRHSVVIVSVLDRQALGFRLGASDYLVKPVDRAACSTP